MTRNFWLFGLFFGWGIGLIQAQLQALYIYHPEQNYGSQLLFSPFSVFINGSYDILRNGGFGHDITQLSYSQGMQNVPRNLGNPFKNISLYNKQEGHDFFSEQILPQNLNVEKASWVPNYQSHLIGEGLITRELAEWYKARGVKYPYAMAIVNEFSSQFMNEVVENGSYVGNNIDPIADIYIFDPLGWLLFAWDPAAKIFGETLHFALWSPQPVYNPINHNLSNAGEEYVIKVDVPFTQSYQIFYSWGIDGNVGLTKKWDTGWSTSLGVGRVADHLAYQKLSQSRFVSAQLKPQIIFCIDRNNSLLLSFAQVGFQEANFRLNMYPGLIQSSGFGGFLGWSPYTGMQLGVTYAFLPLGLFAGN